MKKAGIIGGSGFIGSHITKTFLAHGFEVKVSTTDISREHKYQHLMALENADHLYISELDVTEKAALQDFVSDCDIVIHAGTPFQLDIKDPQTELFEPTVKGTENFLDVVKNTPGIEKVVLIASVAGYNSGFPMPVAGKSPTDPFDENDQKFIDPESHPYGQAKFLANQTVEKFTADYPNLSFEITSVSPVFVIGKALSQREDSTSGGMQFLFKNKLSPNPFVQMLYDLDVLFAMVDVRDVAQAVYRAATTNGLHGKNYLLSSESYPISDISAMLNAQSPVQKPLTVYRNDLAKTDLNMDFNPARDALNWYVS